MSHAHATNRLIETLPVRIRQRLIKLGQEVPLTYGDILTERGQLTRYAYFPLAGWISLIAVVGDTAPTTESLEIELVGSEGMLGLSLSLGVASVANRAMVQGSGAALRIPSAAFRRELKGSAALRRCLGRYVHLHLGQLSQTAVCTCFHALDARLARWLLMTHDRAQADQFYVTQDLLANMLGVQRSGVSRAASVLQRQNLIRYSRGNVTVLDRKGLERASCACYQVLVDDYRRLLG